VDGLAGCQGRREMAAVVAKEEPKPQHAVCMKSESSVLVNVMSSAGDDNVVSSSSDDLLMQTSTDHISDHDHDHLLGIYTTRNI